MMDPQRFETPNEPIPLDITRMPTVRLVPPGQAGDMARRRAELAERHEMEARRLRSIADTAMARFERGSQDALAGLEEWRALEAQPVRTLAQEQRFRTLRRELERLEASLANQWRMISDALRTAAHHEASAQILRSGRVHQH